jgi:hypothetical protein
MKKTYLLFQIFTPCFVVIDRWFSMFKVPYLEKRLGSAAKGTLATAEDIEDLSDLKTVDKTCIVGAINEGLSAKGVDVTREQVFPTIHSSFIAESWFGHLQGRLWVSL